MPGMDDTTRPETSLDALRPWLDAGGYERVLLITGRGRRFVDRVVPLLASPPVAIFDAAVAHVPRAVVDAAEQVVDDLRPDAAVTLGGGAATGLGKALRLSRGLPFAAIPTTYAGSEMTGIYGITGEVGGLRGKQTGRDDRVRPGLVIHDVALTRDMPRRLTVTSLLNALAHPLSALSTGRLDGAAERQALSAVAELTDALHTLAGRPRHAEARRQALRGAALAGRVLDAGPMGEHHRLAHFLGGRLGADHASLHAALLPHTVARLLASDAELGARIAGAASTPDLPGALHELLVRVGAPVALAALAAPDDVARALAEVPGLSLSEAAGQAAHDAALGRNPSRRYERVELGLDEPAALSPAPAGASRIIVALHGRGATAEAIAAEARCIAGDDPSVAVLAPQAAGGSWYPGSYAAPLARQGFAVDRALAAVSTAIEWASERVGPANVVLLGFSQGACLAVEWLARSERPIGGLVALSGARIGPVSEQPAPAATHEGVPVLLTIARGDGWVASDDTAHTAAVLRAAGADVELLEAPEGPHRIRPLERLAARRIVVGREPPAPLTGFGSAHEAEALPGALPRDQNSPRRPPYGLYAEQINGTGFVAPRHANRRVWMYRIRPPAQHTTLEPLAHPTWSSDFAGPAEPNLAAWAPPPIPTAPTDFIDGLMTLGGAGSAALRRGWAVHLYAANRSMDDRAFYSGDSTLLIVPQRGRLTLQTEHGILRIAPGHLAVLPRGVRFSVLLPDGEGRGTVGEVYGRHFELPERGPVGANGLTDPRHFVAPAAHHEDRLHPGYRITAQLGGQLFEATQDHSPYDVVAWHGNHTPYTYDLRCFSPVSNTRFDHGDPSVHTVLTSSLDEPGSHGLDFVFFAPRWDPTEHTFRPPFLHRNATTEVNGIIADPTLPPGSPFQPGLTFLTPAMTPHGVVARAAERALATGDEAADRPRRTPDGSMWFQFESALPLHLTAWARRTDLRIADWPDIWGVYRSRFDARRV